ncbi:hypothetical protein L249_0071 [Ophiocordyceps polyrhachis-furcata BCC 54312]|uniref:Uncharacterized protein n=1 Tax=Ophiocordyceps polyrhachis-furcata BCC 54312 TaxID=1330021 RepID=A0A367LF53_9HYPO|nr:hypothetical protein L249_0071 [Ophiocordyceps polyrhachis-furcata BCC 54312]
MSRHQDDDDGFHTELPHRERLYLASFSVFPANIAIIIALLAAGEALGAPKTSIGIPKWMNKKLSKYWHSKTSDDGDDVSSIVSYGGSSAGSDTSGSDASLDLRELRKSMRSYRASIRGKGRRSDSGSDADGSDGESDGSADFPRFGDLRKSVRSFKPSIPGTGRRWMTRQGGSECGSDDSSRMNHKSSSNRSNAPKMYPIKSLKVWSLILGIRVYMYKCLFILPRT